MIFKLAALVLKIPFDLFSSLTLVKLTSSQEHCGSLAERSSTAHADLSFSLFQEVEAASFERPQAGDLSLEVEEFAF